MHVLVCSWFFTFNRFSWSYIFINFAAQKQSNTWKKYKCHICPSVHPGLWFVDFANIFPLEPCKQRKESVHSFHLDLMVKGFIFFLSNNVSHSWLCDVYKEFYSNRKIKWSGLKKNICTCEQPDVCNLKKILNCCLQSEMWIQALSQNFPRLYQ